MEATNFPITHWSEDDKPREKMMLKGKSALSDAELVAILIGSGSRNESAVALSKRILASVNNNLSSLGKQSLAQLMEFKGIGEAKAITIAAALELGRRRKEENPLELVKVTSSKVMYQEMYPIIGKLAHEEFWVVYLNNANKIIFKAQLSKGGITGTVIDIRLIIKEAIENLATNIVLIHNHPSGNPKPSEDDNNITLKLKEACKLLDIYLMDHVIVCDNSYYSYRDNDCIL